MIPDISVFLRALLLLISQDPKRMDSRRGECSIDNPFEEKQSKTHRRRRRAQATNVNNNGAAAAVGAF
jgi:hypothetical protein